MNAVSTIREILDPKVLQSRLLIESLIAVPSMGATPELLAGFERELPRPLSEMHRAVLSVWNGIDLDVIRILGVPPTENGIATITNCQGLIPVEPRYSGAIAFASDPSGYIYFALLETRTLEGGVLFSVIHRLAAEGNAILIWWANNNLLAYQAAEQCSSVEELLAVALRQTADNRPIQVYLPSNPTLKRDCAKARSPLAPR